MTRRIYGILPWGLVALGLSIAMAIVSHPGIGSTVFVFGLVGGMLLLSWLPPVAHRRL